ncbi:Rubrerythrin [Trichlorobacter thiogenes]|uniref:Rubrerythrin n=1 Tax=Trichlorobacter thiogenes TaxID=115783 RepID=A0A1T4QY03_9BACT|nr:ferritin family protein [Trichlorobacter thiogenes]SKA08427.1 Rubrerythrin [Trichlorobacter thiogenes]
MNILECAIQMELETKNHYCRLAQRVSQQELKQMFTLLAAAEEEHGNVMSNIKNIPDLASIHFKALKEAICIFRPFPDLHNISAELAYDMDAYHYVIHEEIKSISYYEDLITKTEDKRTQDIFTHLLEEEQKHLSLLENIYIFRNPSNTFSEAGKFSNLKQTLHA